MSRVEESRRKVQQRLTEIGEQAEREKARVQRVKDAAVAVVAAVGVLLAARRLLRGLGPGAGKGKAKRGAERQGSRPPRGKAR